MLLGMVNFIFKLKDGANSEKPNKFRLETSRNLACTLIQSFLS